MVVALVALVLSVVLTRRVTRSLEQLADAATAVAAGDLQRTVRESGDDEVGRVARAFNAMTESLRRSLGELSDQRALAAVGEFAASLSHEVRNSLTAVGVDLQHATRRLPDDSAGRPLVTRALESVRRLDATVSSALRVARSGQVAKCRVDLQAVLHRAIQSAEPSFLFHHALLDPLDQHRTVFVDGDTGALEQLFLNLLINAAQASPSGARVRVEIHPGESHVAVRVTDRGAGIPSEVSTQLGTLMRSTKPYGSGLGLPIARRIAMAHGGDITFEATPERGTTAVVSLPLASTSMTGPPTSPTP
jgi:signal transduction histidine kinase